MIAAFSALVAILIILVVQRHDTDKKGLYRKTRNFVIISFLIEFNYFLSFYKEMMLDNLIVGPVWRTFDYTVWILVYYFWILLMDELIGGDRLEGYKRFYKYTTFSAIVLFGIGCIFFMDDYYIVSSFYGQFYLFICTGLFAAICFFIMWKFLHKTLHEIPNSLPRIYVTVVTVTLAVLHISHMIVDGKLYLGLYGQSGWGNEILDPVWLVFLVTNIATIVFIYKADFSPVYYRDEHGNETGIGEVVHEDEDVAKINRSAELHRLTQREREVLFLAYYGMTNPEISEKLFISRNTVKKHMHSIFEKMDVSTRMEIVHLINSRKSK